MVEEHVELGSDVRDRYTIFDDIVYCLDIEGFLDFGVGGDVQMEQN